MPVEPSEWTEVELTSSRGAVAQRWIAVVLSLTGAIGVVFSFFLQPEWWAVISMILACLFIVVIAISLWFNAGQEADATVELLKGGSRVPLRVLSAEEVHDDSIVFRLLLRLPVDELVVVQHQCSQGQCIEAARAAPGSEVPAIIDPKTKSWGVVHGRLDG